MANDELVLLEALKKKAQQLNEEKKATEEIIRNGLIEKSIVFMDIVGSTEFKTRFKDNPETWILRVKQFSDILTDAVNFCNGKVVKYIGDEVMASFNNIHDAANLVGRVSEIEETLKSVTGFETRIKVTIDFGYVYELEFKNHNVLDPQGTAVDRCARIAKYAVGGEVISSASFVAKTPKLKWMKIGSVELKGLEKQVIYQLGKISITLDEIIDVKKEEYEKLLEELQDLKVSNSHYKEDINQLKQQIKEIGQKPIETFTENDDDWQEVAKAIGELRKIIEDAPVNSKYYARFIFLHCTGKNYEKYDISEGKIFNDLIENKLVNSDYDNGYYCLDITHRRNEKILELLEKIDRCLGKYLSENEQDPDDLFGWSMSDPEFWNKYIHYNVN